MSRIFSFVAVFILMGMVLHGCQETDPSKRVPKSQRKAEAAKTAAEAKEEAISYVFPDPIGFVNDFSNVLDQDQRDTLETIIRAHQQKTTNEIAIVTIKDMTPYDNIYDFSFDLANEWGVGVVDKNNGVVIVLNDSLGMVRINTGLGIEAMVPDSSIQKIIDGRMLPLFAEGKLYDGLREGTKAVVEALESIPAN